MPLATSTRNPKCLRHDPSPKSRKGTWADEMDEDELFGQPNFNPNCSGTPHPYTHQTDLYLVLRVILLRSISEAKITTKNILMLTKSPSIAESHIIDKALELLSIITGKSLATTFHNGAQPDKQILEILTKLTEKVDKLSEQINKPRKRVLRIIEPKESVTNFIQPYLYQFFNDSHGLNGYRKPSKRPVNLCQSHLETINIGQDIRQIN